MSKEVKNMKRKVEGKLIPGIKNHRQAAAEGHLFNFNNRSKDKLTTYYSCVSFRKGCRAKLIVRKDPEDESKLDTVLSGTHIQPQCRPNHARIEARAAVATAKRLAISQPEMPVAQIMSTLESMVVNNEEAVMQLGPSCYLQRNIRRAKEKAKIGKITNVTSVSSDKCKDLDVKIEPEDNQENYGYHSDNDDFTTQDFEMSFSEPSPPPPPKAIAAAEPNTTTSTFTPNKKATTTTPSTLTKRNVLQDTKNSRKDPLVELEHVTCLINSDSVNITCDRCSLQFTSLSIFLQHLHTKLPQHLLLSQKPESDPNSPQSVKTPSRTSLTIRRRKSKSKSKETESDSDSSYSPEFENDAGEADSDHGDDTPSPDPQPTSPPKQMYNNSQMKKRGRPATSIAGPCICDICGLELPTAHRLKSHLYSHSSDRPFVCSVTDCNRAYKRNWELTKHMTSHSSNRDFLCPTCGASFRTNGNLMHHMTIHREYTKKCPECDRVFRLKTRLKEHIRSVHRNEKPFVCSYCGADFKHHSTWKYHEMAHRGEKPRKCPEPGCNYACIRPFKLQLHYKRVHAKMKNQSQVQVHVPVEPPFVPGQFQEETEASWNKEIDSEPSQSSSFAQTESASGSASVSGSASGSRLQPNNPFYQESSEFIVL